MRGTMSGITDEFEKRGLVCCTSILEVRTRDASQMGAVDSFHDNYSDVHVGVVIVKRFAVIFPGDSRSVFKLEVHRSVCKVADDEL